MRKKPVELRDVSHCRLCHHIRGFLLMEAGVGTREFGSVAFYEEARMERGIEMRRRKG